MPYSTAAKNLMLDALGVAADWVTLHTATVLSSGASIGANQVSVDHQVDVGATVKLDPQQSNEETHSVTAVDGAGPYTLTLAATLANNHDAGEYVSYTPSAAVGPKEPTGGAPAFARKQMTWNLATGGVLDSSVMPEFDVAPNVPLTHVVVMDEESSDAIFAWTEIILTLYDQQSVFRLRDVDLDLNL